MPSPPAIELPASEAIPKLMEEHGGKIYGLGLRVCSGPAEAEDLVQETFLRAFRHWDQFQGQSAPSSWLYTIATRVCRRMHRRRAGEPRRVESLAELLPSADEAVVAPPEHHDPLANQLRREAQEQVQRALGELPLDFRMPLMLKDIAELSMPEIAKILGIKEGTVKTRIHRGRLKLRRVLSESLEAGAPTPIEQGPIEGEEERGVAGSELTPSQPHSRQVCLDLLRAKQEGLDRGVDLPLSADELCSRCSALFRSLDLTVGACRDLGQGDLPEKVRQALEEEIERAA